jgi:hypothetical protein
MILSVVPTSLMRVPLLVSWRTSKEKLIAITAAMLGAQFNFKVVDY